MKVSILEKAHADLIHEVNVCVNFLTQTQSTMEAVHTRLQIGRQADHPSKAAEKAAALDGWSA